VDWTDFNGDKQTTNMLSLITRHGRRTPLVLIKELKFDYVIRFCGNGAWRGTHHPWLGWSARTGHGPARCTDDRRSDTRREPWSPPPIPSAPLLSPDIVRLRWGSKLARRTRKHG